MKDMDPNGLATPEDAPRSEGAPESEWLASLGELGGTSLEEFRSRPMFREQLFQKTSRLVGRRRHRRKLWVAAAVLLAYCAGVGTTALLGDGNEPGPVPFNPGTAIGGELAVAHPAERSTDTDAPQHPGDWESLAAQSEGEERNRYLRLAGDGYFTQVGGLDDAVRCYREYLDGRGESGGSEPVAEESWLLLAMQDAREPGE